MFVSIVSPVYNEELGLREFIDRLLSTLNNSPDLNFEVLLIDDGSSDATPSICRELCAGDPRIHHIRFSRNFGHQAALLAGLHRSNGDAVVFIDSDLQDPPELIPRLIEEWQSGADVVHARRIERQGETKFKLASAQVFYRTIRWLAEVDLATNVADFRLVDRRVIEVVRNMPERSLYLRGLFTWVGFRQSFVDFRREERFAGTTKYSLRKMVRLATDGLFSFSERPLRIFLRIGTGVTALAFSVGTFFLVTNEITSEPGAPGWLSLMLVTLMLGGIQLIFFSLLSEYILRIYRETKGRPVYIIDGGRNSEK